MLSRRKQSEKAKRPNQVVAKQSMAADPKKAKARAAPSIISADMRIKGAIDSDGEIQMDGRMEGNLRGVSLTIGENAQVDGDITANEVSIRGRVNGNIRARKVNLTGSAHVKGDIFQKTLSIETGAVVDGRCNHVEDPLSGTVSKNSSSGAPAANNGTGPRMRVVKAG